MTAAAAVIGVERVSLVRRVFFLLSLSLSKWRVEKRHRIDRIPGEQTRSGALRFSLPLDKRV